MRSFASAPLAAPLPRRSGAESFWNSRRRGLRPRCGGQFQLSFSWRRVGSPPLRRTFALCRVPPRRENPSQPS